MDHVVLEYVFIEKKSAFKRTHVAPTCIVEGSPVKYNIVTISVSLGTKMPAFEFVTLGSDLWHM